MTQNTNRHMIDEIAQNKLFEYEVAPPSDVWDKINNKLRKRKLRLWWITTGAMAATVALVISAGLGYYLGSNHQRKILTSTKVHQTIENKVSSSSHKSVITSTAVNRGNVDFGEKENNFPNNNESFITNTDQTIQNKPSELMASSNINSSESFELMSPKEFNGFDEDEQYSVLSQKANDSKHTDQPTSNVIAKEVSKVPIVWALGGNVAPIYSYRNIQSNGSTLSTSYLNNTETPILSVSGGFNIKFGRNKWRVESGIYYKQIGQEISNISVNYLSGANSVGYVGSSTGINGVNFVSLNSSFGSLERNSSSTNAIARNVVISNKNSILTPTAINNNSSQSTTTAKYLFQYLEIPVMFKYKFMRWKSDIGITAGLSTNMLIKNSILLKYNNSYVNLGTTSGLNKFSVAGIIGVSYEIPIVPKIYLAFEPRFTYYLNSISKNSEIETHPYSMGIFTGVSYRF